MLHVTVIAFSLLLPVLASQTVDKLPRSLQKEVPKVRDPVLQRKRVQCGPNSLYMLLRSKGINVSFEEIEKTLRMTDAGTSLLDLKDAAAKLGLRTQTRKCSSSDLAALSLPAIAHFRTQIGGVSEQNHFVVLIAVDAAGTTFLDGTTGERFSCPVKKFEEYWSGYLLEPVTPADISLATLTVLPFVLVVGTLIVALARRSRRGQHFGQLSSPGYLTFLGAACFFNLSPSMAADIKNSSTWRTAERDGVNCIAMQLALLDQSQPYEAILAASPAASERPSFLDLKRTVERLGLSAVIERATPASIEQIPLPVIVQLSDDAGQGGEFCVLFQIDKQSYKLVHGSSVAPDVMSVDRFRRRWSGHVMSITGNTADMPWYATIFVFSVSYLLFRNRMGAALTLLRAKIGKSESRPQVC